MPGRTDSAVRQIKCRLSVAARVRIFARSGRGCPKEGQARPSFALLSMIDGTTVNVRTQEIPISISRIDGQCKEYKADIRDIRPI